MRRILLLAIALLASGAARAQTPLAVGTPQAAFAGGPIHLTPHAAALLRAHYHGDNVPMVPQSFRGRLDTALAVFDWPRVRLLKKQLEEKDGPIAALLWEQSRVIATGSIGLAELHALDVAATGASGLSETAAMMWFYAVAVTMTDGEKCVDSAARDAHLDYLRGPTFDPVLRIIRGLADDRLAAMRDLAIRLETVLAEDRTDDTMCRPESGGGAAPRIKPVEQWKPEAARARAMLPRDLLALAAVMRPQPRAH